MVAAAPPLGGGISARRVSAVKDARPKAPPTPKDCGIKSPSAEQEAAHAEAVGPWKEARTRWREANSKRKKAVKKAGRPANDGARASAHRAEHPELLQRHSERERVVHHDAQPEPTEADIMLASLAEAGVPRPDWECVKGGRLTSRATSRLR